MIPLVLKRAYDEGTPEGLFREAVEVQLYDLRGRSLGVLIEAEGSELFHYSRQGRRVVIRPVLHDELLRAVAGGRLWLVNSESGRTRLVSGEGTVLLDLDLALPRPDLDPATIAEALDREGVSGPSQIVGLFDEAFRAAPEPQEHPMIGDLVGASSGSVWVSGFAGTERVRIRWIRIDPTGIASYAIELEEGETILDERDGFVLTHAADEFGRPLVRLHRVTGN